jgi:aldose 1-epimerase
MAGVSVSEFGQKEGKKIYVFTMENLQGHVLQITNFGGIVHSWKAPDNRGHISDLLLGCRDLNGYLERHPYFGAVIGRYANRIAGGTFELDGQNYHLEKNLFPHHLHGGVNGFDRKVWDYDTYSSDHQCTLSLTTQSEHMEEGYPGHLDVKVNYTFTDGNELIIEYFAVSDRDTVINLTNHCYFNLSGNQNGDILDHSVKINADEYTESDETLIPTGRLLPVADTNLDFLDFHTISERIFSADPLLQMASGYDHNFVLRAHEFDNAVAEVRHQSSGRRLLVFTDQLGLQLYTGYYLKGVDGKIGKYGPYAGFCLETQHFPDSPNHPEFPTTLLKKGEKYYSKTIYKVDTM